MGSRKRGEEEEDAGGQGRAGGPTWLPRRRRSTRSIASLSQRQQGTQHRSLQPKRIPTRLHVVAFVVLPARGAHHLLWPLGAPPRKRIFDACHGVLAVAARGSQEPAAWCGDGGDGCTGSMSARVPSVWLRRPGARARGWRRRLPWPGRAGLPLVDGTHLLAMAALHSCASSPLSSARAASTSSSVGQYLRLEAARAAAALTSAAASGVAGVLASLATEAVSSA